MALEVRGNEILDLEYRVIREASKWIDGESEEGFLYLCETLSEEYLAYQFDDKFDDVTRFLAYISLCVLQESPSCLSEDDIPPADDGSILIKSLFDLSKHAFRIFCSGEFEKDDYKSEDIGITFKELSEHLDNESIDEDEYNMAMAAKHLLLSVVAYNNYEETDDKTYLEPCKNNYEKAVLLTRNLALENTAILLKLAINKSARELNEVVFYMDDVYGYDTPDPVGLN